MKSIRTYKGDSEPVLFPAPPQKDAKLSIELDKFEEEFLNVEVFWNDTQLGIISAKTFRRILKGWFDGLLSIWYEPYGPRTKDLTLEEAIIHADEKADDTPCGREHAQLRDWLIELKERRENE